MQSYRTKTIWFAGLGLGVTVVLWAYSSFFDYSRPMTLGRGILGTLLVVLCPPSLLTMPMWELDMNSRAGTIIWTVIGLLNSALYAWPASKIIQRSRKPETVSPEK